MPSDFTRTGKRHYSTAGPLLTVPAAQKYRTSAVQHAQLATHRK